MISRLVLFSIYGFITAPIHIIGLILLYKKNHREIKGTQKYLITALSLVEIGFVTLAPIRDLISYITDDEKNKISAFIMSYVTIVLCTLFYLVMFGITIDRLLAIFLNIKYNILWRPAKTKILLWTIFVFLNILNILTPNSKCFRLFISFYSLPN